MCVLVYLVLCCAMVFVGVWFLFLNVTGGVVCCALLHLSHAFWVSVSFFCVFVFVILLVFFEKLESDSIWFYFASILAKPAEPFGVGAGPGPGLGPGLGPCLGPLHGHTLAQALAHAMGMGSQETISRQYEG